MLVKLRLVGFYAVLINMLIDVVGWLKFDIDIMLLNKYNIRIQNKILGGIISAKKLSAL